MAKNKLFSSAGKFGIKASGKWGRLNADERRIYAEGRKEGKTPAQIAQDIVQSTNPAGKDTAQLKADLRRLQKTVNTQARRLRDYYHETGQISPALKELDETGGNISAAGNDYDVLLREYMRAMNFLSDPTHTISGTKDFYKDIAEIGDAWIIVDRLAAVDPRVNASKENRYKTYDAVESLIMQRQYSKDEIFEIVYNMLDKILSDNANYTGGLHGFSG